MIFQSYFTQVYGIPLSIKISLKTISGRFKGGRRPPLSPTKKGKVVLNYSSKQCGSKGGGMHIYRKKSQKNFLIITIIEQTYSYTTFHTMDIWTLLQPIITVEQIYSYTTFYTQDSRAVTVEQDYSYTAFLCHGYMASTTTYHHCRTDLQLYNVL